MDFKEYISSGIIEEYVLGCLSKEASETLEKLAASYEEIRIEIQLAEKALEDYLQLFQVSPPDDVKSGILHTINSLDEDIDLKSLPSLHKYSVREKWDKAVRHIRPPGEFENIHLHQLYGDAERMLAKAWVKNFVPIKSHDDIMESFLILEGNCECCIGDEVYQLGPGDYLDIPLNVNHNIKVTSDQPVVAILQRLAA